jgi:uncharacterized protein
MAERIVLEVAYAQPDGQWLRTVEVEAESTAAQAVEASGILSELPQLDIANLQLGIFGRLVASDTIVVAGDRVEIYRALKIDPKEARRRRAQHRT